MASKSGNFYFYTTNIELSVDVLNAEVESIFWGALMTENKTSLLFVDDEPDILTTYQEIFGDMVEAVHLATNGIEALEILRTQPIDVIVSDISMPKMDGIELLEKVRQQNVAIPFIIVTGYGDKGNAVKALRLGAFDLIDKPIRIETLRTRISAALSASQQLKSLSGLMKSVFQPLQGPENKVVSFDSKKKEQN